MRRWSRIAAFLVFALLLTACAVPAAPAAPAAPAEGAAAPAAEASADEFLLGLVSITPSDSSNARFINGATQAAEALGWTVSVIDARGSADEANAAW